MTIFEDEIVNNKTFEHTNLIFRIDCSQYVEPKIF